MGKVLYHLIGGRIVPENEKGAVVQKTPRHRSPNYPGISLKAAVEKISLWYKQDGLVASFKESAMSHMGGGDVGRVISALKSFGLVIENDDGRIKLTQRGIDIVARTIDDTKRKQALREAAVGPSIYRELIKEYASGVPSDATLQAELIAGRKFNPAYVKDFIKDFRATLDFCGISSSDVVESNLDENKQDPAAAKIGDYVQWESQGTYRFPIPKQISGFSDDGKWAFFEGSETGVSVSDLIVTDAPHEVLQPPEKLRSATRNSPPLNPQHVATLPPNTKQDVFSVGEGVVTISWPTSISSDSFEDISGWLDILKRKIGRSVTKAHPQE
jgi:hypothetical protein